MVAKASILKPSDYFTEDQQREVIDELDDSYTDLSSMIV